MIPLREVSTVLLDMDGTLLDRYFDDYFWEHLLPEMYAEKHHITFGKAKETLLSKYKAHEGTLNWTDIDFWSQELTFDIPALKEQIRHLIEVHPHVEDFLMMLRRHNKKVCLVTNAHYKVMDLKLKKTDLGRHFDRCITAFELGFPKERLEFWEKAERILGFDKEKTLFIDDNQEILRTARRFGIAHLLLKSKANSRREDLSSDEFPVLADFSDLITLD
ncbi:MAG: HAD-IA family hydrolase [Nitrospirales bacterium]|nr:HAD-IA family hydrolase [Nitrospirales bacterium]